MSESLQQEFTQIIEDNKGLIYRVANTYCGDVDDKSDLFQEIVEQLWRSYPRYDDQYALSTWIYRIALNVAISSLRRQKVRNRNRVEFSEAFIKTSPPESNDEDIVLLNRFISEFPPLDKALILLYLEDRKAKEIAEILGISESNVSTRVGRLKKRLKMKFDALNR